MTNMREAVVRAGAAVVVAAAGIGFGCAVSHAEPETTEAPTSEAPTSTEAPTSEAPTSTPQPSAGGAGHQVTYTITATSDLNVDVQYIATDPPSQAAYNNDAEKYLTTLRRTPIGGGQSLVYTTTLADPGKWALITASGGLRINPELHCEIAVDGAVVVSVQGGSGVTCSTRPW